MGCISIVVPCFNARNTLAATVESALGQDGITDIVIVDDGSTDGSLALARSFEPRVTVLTGPNRGVAAARNRGTLATTTDWLLFLDSDDLLAPGTVARRLAAVGDRRSDVAITDWECFEGEEEVGAGQHCRLEWEFLNDDPERALATRVWAPPAAILYSRALIAGTGGFRGDVSPVEDARMLFDVAHAGARFTYSPHLGARYRVSAGSLSRADPARFWTSVLRNGQQIEAIWRSSEAFGPERRRSVFEIYDTAARALFRAGHPDYFAATASIRGLGLPRSRYNRIMEPLARVVGLPAARAGAALLGHA